MESIRAGMPPNCQCVLDADWRISGFSNSLTRRQLKILAPYITMHVAYSESAVLFRRIIPLPEFGISRNDIAKSILPQKHLCEQTRAREQILTKCAKPARPAESD